MPAYIHEKPDWPKFTWDDKALAQLLAETHLRQGKLLGRMHDLGFQLQEQAVLETLTTDVLKSSEIEGEILDQDQVRSSIARHLGMEVVGVLPADRSIDGVVEMMLDATQKYEKPLTSERLFGWHSLLFPTGRSHGQKITVGNWRTDKEGAMEVVSGVYGKQRVHYTAPPAARVAMEMAAFLEWFNNEQGIDALLKAAIAHLWFVSIHPFDDGNGRIARAIADMQLARSEKSTRRFYSMSAQIRIERNKYYDMLESTQKRDLDVTEWLKWFLACLDRAFGRAETVLQKVIERGQFWVKHRGLAINERQRDMLNRLLTAFEGKLTTTKWAKIEKCSQDTATRDINELVEMRILKQEGAGRSTAYTLRDA